MVNRSVAPRLFCVVAAHTSRSSCYSSIVRRNGGRLCGDATCRGISGPRCAKSASRLRRRIILRGLFFARRACLTVWRCKSSSNLMEVKDSEAQRRHREVGSEGSAEQNRDLTYRNRIRGHANRANWQRTVKPISIKGSWGKSGRCAGKTVKLTSGGLHRVRNSGLRGL